MNVPLSWLSDYVDLPKDHKVLTDRLTMIGHMLDKTQVHGKDIVLDLELRGNRSDMFGLVGVARDIAAAFNTTLKLPEIAKLPPVDKKSNLVVVEKTAAHLIKRFMAVHLKVKVGPSPKWLSDKLQLYGVPSINNLVDITNFVMIETGIPLHAFDYHKIANGQLVLRLAKPDEDFQTIQQGQTLKLSHQDLVVGDALMMIGGINSKVTNETTEIILEAAVYDSGSCRRSARRLKVFTEAGMRLEKHLDPNQVEFALARAVQLIEGDIKGNVSDFYPYKVTPLTLDFDFSQVNQLSGLDVPKTTASNILQRLEFEIKNDQVIVPTFRTDVENSADIVEEIVRIVGYENIPETPITDTTPSPSTYPQFAFAEKLRDVLTTIGLNEAITLTMVDTGDIALVNPPDPDLKWLRKNIYPSLVSLVKKQNDLQLTSTNFFEIGKTFSAKNEKYLEHNRLSIAVNKNLSSVLQTLQKLLGVDSLPLEYGKINNIYWAEIDLDKLITQVPVVNNLYSVVSQFPPIVEDINVKYTGDYKKIVTKIKKISALIKQIDFVDLYNDKLTLRITYHDAKRQLSSADIASVREKLDSLD